MGTEVRDFGLSAGGGVNATSGWFPEGQLPGTVNDGARSLMGAVRRAIGDLSGEQTATYSAGTYSLASNMDVSALARGHAFSGIWDGGNSGSANLAVNGLSGVPIKIAGRHVLKGEIPAKGAFLAVYDGAAAQLVGVSRVVQRVEATPITTYQSTNFKLPTDNSVPQNTEGSEYITVSITPTKSANRLVIECTGMVGADSSINAGIALFQDSTAGALAATAVSFPGAAYVYPFSLRHEMAAGTTSSTTFKIRIGRGADAGSITINGASSGAFFDNTCALRLSVTEIEA